MTDRKNKATAKHHLPRSLCLCCAIVALSGLSLVTSAGCDEEVALRAFRDASTSNLETGVKSIMDGIIEGIFAAVDSGDGSESSSSSSSG